MKNLTYFITLVLTLTSNSIFAQDGVLDTSFGDNGIVLTHQPQISTYKSIGFQSDGKIIAIGETEYIPFTAYITRYNTNGSIDTSFGDNGIITLPFDNQSNSSFLEHVTVLPNDKFIISGHRKVSGNTRMYLTRYNSDGTSDDSFAMGNGSGHFMYGSWGPIIILPSNWILAAGIVNSNHLALSRLQPDGYIDYNFGDSGTASVIISESIFSDNVINAAKLDNDNKIVVAGYKEWDILMGRFNPDGSIDMSFGDNGIVTTNIEDTTREQINSIVTLPDNKIIAAGKTGNYMIILKYNVDGSLDSSFGDNGKLIFDSETERSNASDVKIQEDGKIIIAGLIYNISENKQVATLIRLNPDGSLDSTFGINGKTDISHFEVPQGVYSKFNTLELYNNTIFAAGSINNKLLVVKYLPNLVLGSINFSTVSNTMCVYPNPLNETNVLEYTLANDEQISIELVDIQGKTVTTYVKNAYQGAGSHKQSIAVPSNLASGTYIVVLSSSKGKATVKVMK